MSKEKKRECVISDQKEMCNGGRDCKKILFEVEITYLALAEHYLPTSQILNICRSLQYLNSKALFGSNFDKHMLSWCA